MQKLFQFLFLGAFLFSFGNALAQSASVPLYKSSYEVEGDSIYFLGFEENKKQAIYVYDNMMKEIWTYYLPEKSDFKGGTLLDVLRYKENMVFIMSIGEITSNGNSYSYKGLLRVIEVPFKGKSVVDNVLYPANSRDKEKAIEFDKKYNTNLEGQMNVHQQLTDYFKTGEMPEEKDDKDEKGINAFLKTKGCEFFQSMRMESSLLVLGSSEEKFKDGVMTSEDGLQFFYGDTAGTFNPSTSGYVYKGSDKSRELFGYNFSDNKQFFGVLSLFHKGSYSDEDVALMKKSGTVKPLFDRMEIDQFDMKAKTHKNIKINFSDLVKQIPYTFKLADRINLIPRVITMNADGTIEMALKVYDVKKMKFAAPAAVQKDVNALVKSSGITYDDYGWIYVEIDGNGKAKVHKHMPNGPKGFVSTSISYSKEYPNSAKTLSKLPYPVPFYHLLSFTEGSYDGLFGTRRLNYYLYYQRKMAFNELLHEDDGKIYYFEMPKGQPGEATVHALDQGEDKTVKWFQNFVPGVYIYFSSGKEFLFMVPSGDGPFTAYSMKKP
jgi:hypothetical protein